MSARIRAPGLWTLASTIDPAEWELFDENQANNIDGRGGTYAPVVQIVIGGDGLRVDGVFETRGTTLIGDSVLDGMVVKASADFQGGFVVSAGLGQFFNGVNIPGGDLTVGPGNTVLASLTVTGAANLIGSVVLGDAPTDGIQVLGSVGFFNGFLVSAGTAQFAGPVNVAGPLTVFGSQFNSLAIFVGPVNFQDPISLSDNAHIRVRVVEAPNADTVYGINDADEIHLLNGVQTTNRAYTLSTIGAADGAVILFRTFDAVLNCTFNGIVHLNTGTGDLCGTRWTFKSGAWRQTGRIIA